MHSTGLKCNGVVFVSENKVVYVVQAVHTCDIWFDIMNYLINGNQWQENHAVTDSTHSEGHLHSLQ